MPKHFDCIAALQALTALAEAAERGQVHEETKGLQTLSRPKRTRMRLEEGGLCGESVFPIAIAPQHTSLDETINEA